MFKVDMWFVIKDGRGRDRVVVEFTITCAISAYHHESCEFESRSWRGALDATLCNKGWHCLAIGRWFSPGTPVSSTKKKTDCHDITKILLNPYNPNPLFSLPFRFYFRFVCCFCFFLIFGMFVHNRNQTTSWRMIWLNTKWSVKTKYSGVTWPVGPQISTSFCYIYVIRRIFLQVYGHLLYISTITCYIHEKAKKKCNWN